MTRRQAALSVDLFAAAVIATVAIALAAVTWRLIAGVPSSALPVVAVPRTDIDVSPILAQSPFGSDAGGAPTATGLPIELRGLISASAPRASTALIAPTGGTALPYAVGQAIPGGATVAAIGIDHVILDVSGHREILTFPRSAAPGSTTPPPTPGATRATGLIPTPGSISATPTAPPPSPPPISPGGALTASPQSVLEGLAATPMPNGYRIGDGLAPAYRQSGLQPGDVIEQVNGTKLGNPATDQQLLASAARAGNVRIDILRGDRRMTLSFPVR